MPSTDSLAQLEAANSPAGLFLRYARGRLRHVLNRQISGTLGAAAVSLTLDFWLGILCAALILLGELVDCLTLARLIRVTIPGPLPARTAQLGALTATLQSLSVSVALVLPLGHSALPEVGFFAAAILTSLAINAGLVRPYFPLGVSLKLAVLALCAVATLRATGANLSSTEVMVLMAGQVMLVLTVVLFIRQTDRAFAQRRAADVQLATQAGALQASQQALAQKAEQAQRLALAAQHANDSIVFLDAEDRYVWVNDAFTRMTGFRFDEAIGRIPGALLNAAETDPKTLAAIDAARRDRVPIRVEIFNRGKDGCGFWVDTSIIPIFDDQGHLMTTMAIEREVTEGKAREAELFRAREEALAAALTKSRFLANMSHEIRTPMNGVIGVAEMLTETSLTPQQSEFVDTILESGRALLRMINDILDLSKLQSGNMPVEAMPFDLAQVSERILRLLHPAAQSKGLTLTLDVDPAIAAVQGDEGKLRQILLNLVGNAIKFTQVGRVEVAARRLDASGPVEITVKDTGIGIPPNRLQSIFDSFTQGDDSISRRFGGTGLGLTISAMLAQQMGGEITVASVMGQGATFTLRLPLPGVSTPLPRPVSGPVLSMPLPADLRVLVAEDNRTNMMILRHMLSGQAGQMFEATDGTAALQMRLDHAPDIILMDISMPVMDGIAAARAIRKAETALGLPAVPILALTAASLMDDRAACLAAGFNGFLVKPLRRDQLVYAIRSHLGGGESLKTG